MKATALFLFLTPAFCQQAFCQQTTLTLDPAQTHVRFTLSDVLHTVRGEFKLKRGAITYDFSTGQASGEIVIDAKSGDSGSGARDSRMNKNVLESDRYPEIVFHPDRVSGTPVKAEVHGKVSIHGADHELTMQVTSTADSISAQFSVPYVQWGMKDPSTFVLKVGKEVEISVDARATGVVSSAR